MAVLCANYCASLAGCSFSKESEDPGDSAKSRHQAADQKDLVGIGKIDGASMAPTYKGSHFSIQCSSCKFPFDFDAANLPGNKKVYCPLCGHAQSVKQASLRTAEKIQLKSIKEKEVVSRWSVVGYQKGGENSIKRVLGLPGESIEIKHGDVYADGQICTKSAADQNKTRILIFDSVHLSQRQLTMLPNPEQIVFPIKLAGGFQLGYLQFPNYQSINAEGAGPIKDFYGYNQGVTRSLNVCHDVGCEVEIGFGKKKTRQRLKFAIQLLAETYGAVDFEIQLNGHNENNLHFDVYQNRKRLFAGVHHIAEEIESMKLYVSIIDGKARLDFGNQTSQSASLSILAKSFELSNQPRVSMRNWNEGSETAMVTASLSTIKIYRDLHYFEKIHRGPRKLENDEFFVVGDNVPVSRDSRNSGILPKRSDLIGKVERIP